MTGGWRSVAVLSAAWLLGGCGALVNGPDQSVKITTLPPGAAISVDGQHLKSPAHVTLRRGRDYTVIAELPGFAQNEGQIYSSPDDMVLLGNCLLLCIPMLWEQGTPSMFRLEPEELDIVLTPTGWSPR